MTERNHLCTYVDSFTRWNNLFDIHFCHMIIGAVDGLVSHYNVRADAYSS